MKYLSSIILSIIIIGLWSCSDIGDPITISCTNELDCSGECGGSAREDCAGTCNGNALGENSPNCTNISYSATIQSIFDTNCSSCHITSTRNNLNLSNYANIMLGNSDNGPVIVAGNPTNSRLWQYVNSGTMPPGNYDLTESQIGFIATWIQEGALDN